MVRSHNPGSSVQTIPAAFRHVATHTRQTPAAAPSVHAGVHVKGEVGRRAVVGWAGLASSAVEFWREGRLSRGVGDFHGWMVQLEQLSMFVRAAAHNGDEKGAPMCPNALASSLGSGEKVVKEGEQ